MDYGKVLSRAWEITWRWKALWVLGFLTAVSSSMSGGMELYRASEADMARWGAGLSTMPLGPLWLSLIGCGTLLLILALWVLATIATGGLVGAVQQIEEQGEVTLKSAWRVGVRRFWRLFGISVLTGLPTVILAVAATVVLVLGIAGLANASGDAGGGLAAASDLTVACGSTLCCALIPVGIVLSVVATYAMRAAVLDNRPWIDSIQHGWRVFRNHLGPTLLMGFILLVLGLGVGVVLGLVALPAVLALVALFRLQGGTGWYVALAVCAGAVTFAVSALVNAVLGTYTSAAWTLTYRSLTARAREEEPAIEPIPAP